MQYTSVDDDVEAAPIYRCDGKAPQPIRPHENHGLHRVYTYMEGELMQATDAVISSSCTGIIGQHIQNPGNTEMHITSVVRLRFTPHAVP